MKKVTVYFFQIYDIISNKKVRLKQPGTLEAIARVKGQAIMETALEIEETELDEDGFRKETVS